MLKRHGLKILIGLYTLLLIGGIIGGLSAKKRINSLSNRVTTMARVLNERLSSTDKPGNTGSRPPNEDAYDHIQSQWTELDDVPPDDFPDVIMPPASSD
ncbi:MAG: hypothetical protein ACOCR1_03375 [Planctomycetota bacterium]